MPPRLMPANRGTDAHTEALRRLVSRGSLVDRFNHTHPQICRIWLGHGAFQKPNRPPRLGLSEPLGNPDSIPTETALSVDTGAQRPCQRRHIHEPPEIVDER